jgi:hypothetical protein
MSNKSVNFREYDIYSFGSIVFAFFSKNKELDQNYDSSNRKSSLSFLEGLSLGEKHIPDLIKDIIRACWNEDFQNRPGFEEICYIFIEYFKQVEHN